MLRRNGSNKVQFDPLGLINTIITALMVFGGVAAIWFGTIGEIKTSLAVLIEKVDTHGKDITRIDSQLFDHLTEQD